MRSRLTWRFASSDFVYGIGLIAVMMLAIQPQQVPAATIQKSQERLLPTPATLATAAPTIYSLVVCDPFLTADGCGFGFTAPRQTVLDIAVIVGCEPVGVCSDMDQDYSAPVPEKTPVSGVDPSVLNYLYIPWLAIG